MNYTQVFYWITVADSIKSALDTFSNIFTFLFLLSGVAYVLCFIGKTSSIEEKQCKSVEEEKTSPQVRAWQKDKIIEEAKNMTASEVIEKMKTDSNFAKIITDK